MADERRDRKAGRRRRPRGYSPTKAAQIAAYMLIRGGGEMAKLKLVKLLYLAERRCAEAHGHLMFNDRHFALEHGPIPTMALNGIDGEADQEVWSRHVEREGNVVRARGDLAVEGLDRLSAADRRIGDELVGRFGGRDGMTASQVRDWTHEHLPEWQGKAASLSEARRRVEITPLDLARGIGHPAPDEFVALDAELRGMAGD